jgi:hypothetical protein
MYSVLPASSDLLQKKRSKEREERMRKKRKTR